MSAKLEIMKIAATLTAGVVSNYADTLTRPDAEQASKGNLPAEVGVENLTGWEIFKRFYGGLVANFQDKAAFPDPPPEVNAGESASTFLNSETIRGLLEKLAAKV
jgi:hypothetical protein